MSKHQTQSLYCVGLFQRVLIDCMRISFGPQLTIFGQLIFNIYIPKERTIAKVIITLTKITIDTQLIDWMNLELRFILLTRIGTLTIGSEVET